jgi:integrase
MQMEADARRLVMEGRSGELAIQPEPFTSAADQFCVWADGEYIEHPNSGKRIRGSMASAKTFFHKKPLSSMTAGDIEDYKAFRRTVHKVKEVTLRHDLHALSLLWQYGKKHNWCRGNLIDEVEIPSDGDATREFVLTEAEEKHLLATIDLMMVEKAAKKRTKDVQGLGDIRDLSVLMLNQGCRPDELRELPQAFVNLEKGSFTISKGKSDAARRTLPMTAASQFILSARLRSPGRWVFPSRRGSGHIGQHQRLWATVVTRAKLDGLVMYDLRHTFATRAVERGVPLPKLMAILGHANLRSIMRYVHMKQEHIDAGMRKFEEPVLERANESLSSSCPVENGKTRENAGSSGNSPFDLTTNKIN